MKSYIFTIVVSLLIAPLLFLFFKNIIKSDGSISWPWIGINGVIIICIFVSIVLSVSLYRKNEIMFKNLEELTTLKTPILSAEEARHELMYELKEKLEFDKARYNDADKQYKMGYQLFVQEKFNESLPHFRKAVDNVPDFFAGNNILGVNYFFIGENKLALAFLQKAFAIAKANNNPAWKVIALVNLSDIYADSGSLNKAFENAQEALSISRETGNRLGEATALDALGRIHLARGNYGRAEEYHKNTLTIYETMNEQVGIAVSLNHLGITYINRGEVEQAFDAYTKAYNIFRDRGIKTGEAASLINIADIERLRGNIQESIEKYNNVITLARGIGNKRTEAIALGNLGVIFKKKGDLNEALRYFNDSLRGLLQDEWVEHSA